MPICFSGDILRDLILRHNGSRHYADEAFRSQALILVSGGLDRLTKSMLKAENGKGGLYAASICQICSLLGATRALIYFLDAPKSQGESGSAGGDDPGTIEAMETDDAITPGPKQGDEDEARDILLRNTVLLLDHPDLAIVREAASLLSPAFAYFGLDCSRSYASGILSAIRCCFKRPSNGSDGGKETGRNVCKKRMIALQGVISVLSRQSPSFANTIMSNIFNEETTPGNPSCIWRHRLHSLSPGSLPSTSSTFTWQWKKTPTKKNI